MSLGIKRYNAKYTIDILALRQKMLLCLETGNMGNYLTQYINIFEPALFLVLNDLGIPAVNVPLFVGYAKRVLGVGLKYSQYQYTAEANLIKQEYMARNPDLIIDGQHIEVYLDALDDIIDLKITFDRVKTLWVPAVSYKEDTLYHRFLLKIDPSKTFSLLDLIDTGLTTETGEYAISFEGSFCTADLSSVYIVDTYNKQISPDESIMMGRLSRIEKTDYSLAWSVDIGDGFEPLGVIEFGYYVFVIFNDQCRIDKIWKIDGSLTASLILEPGSHNVESRFIMHYNSKIYAYSKYHPVYLHEVDPLTFLELRPRIRLDVGDPIDQIFGFFGGDHKDTLYFAGDVWFASAFMKKVDLNAWTSGLRGGPYLPEMFSHSGSAYYSDYLKKCFCFEHGISTDHHHYIHKINADTLASEGLTVDLQPWIDPYWNLQRWSMIMIFDNGYNVFSQSCGDANPSMFTRVIRFNRPDLAFDPDLDILTINDYQAGLGFYG
jgi:hypothetical protein